MNEEKPIDRSKVRQFIIDAHGNLKRTRDALEEDAGLLHACWNWSEGDWETALGAAAHTGQKDIANFLLDRGARLDIFAAAMLDRVEIVRSIIEIQPSAATTPGPHGIPLLAHAEAGKAARVIEYLRCLKPQEAPAKKERAAFEGVIPILSVKNVTASIDHYVNTLGFKKCWDWGTPPTFGCVARDGVEIFFCQGAQGKSGTWMSIFMDNVDALHEEYQQSGAAIRQPPTNFPWGMREMNIEDLDGHRLRMGSGTKAPSDGVPLCVK